MYILTLFLETRLDNLNPASSVLLYSAYTCHFPWQMIFIELLGFDIWRNILESQSQLKTAPGSQLDE